MEYGVFTHYEVLIRKGQTTITYFNPCESGGMKL